MDTKSILLVEDNFLNRRLSKKTLSENGYRVLEAKNSEEAFEVLKKEKLDLIILDINLGEGEQDGISLGQQISDKYSIPFIYLTAYDNIEMFNKAIATTPYSYLTKPFRNVDLIATVEVALRQSEKVNKYKPTIAVKEGSFKVALPIDEIDYIKSDGNYLLFHSGQQVYKSRSTIAQIMETLPETTFVQIHRAYVVNKNKIQEATPQNIVISNTTLPISKNYSDVLSKLDKQTD